MQGDRSLWIKTIYGNWVNTKYVVAFNEKIWEEDSDKLRKGEKYYHAKTVTNEYYSISESMFKKFQNHYLSNNEMLDDDKF